MGKRHENLGEQLAPTQRGNRRPPAGIAMLPRLIWARWPSVVGLLALLANISDGPDPHLASLVIILAAMCYLGAAALGFARAGWLMVGASIVVVFAAALAGVDKTVAGLVLGMGLGIYGLVRAPGGQRGEVAVQGIAFLGFSALALSAMLSQPVLAAYLAAAAALSHCAWDVIHFVRNKVVERSLTEFCFVLDLGLGVALLLAAWGLFPA